MIAVDPEGTARRKGGILSFVMDCAHPQDIGTILDQSGVAVRTGHHCTMPLMERMGLAATARASFYVYNTEADVDALMEALKKAADIFKV